MSSNECELKCRIQKGMFEDEYLVVIRIIDDKGEDIEAASFIDKEELRVESFPTGSEVVDGYLTVSPVEITRGGAFVVLPKSTLANGPIVSVKASELIPRQEVISS